MHKNICLNVSVIVSEIFSAINHVFPAGRYSAKSTRIQNARGQLHIGDVHTSELRTVFGSIQAVGRIDRDGDYQRAERDRGESAAIVFLHNTRFTPGNGKSDYFNELIEKSIYINLIKYVRFRIQALIGG